MYVCTYKYAHLTISDDRYVSKSWLHLRCGLTYKIIETAGMLILGPCYYWFSYYTLISLLAEASKPVTNIYN